jgi:tetratricopeptide (TPR) repeat protein
MLSLGRVQFRLGRLDDALATVQATVARLADPATRPRAQVAPFTEANAHAQLARIFVAAGRWSQALEAADHALALAEELGLARISAAAYQHRGLARAGLGDRDGAVADLENAVAVRRETRDAEMTAEAEAALAHVRTATGAATG